MFARLGNGHQRWFSFFVAHAELSYSKPRLSATAPVRNVELSTLSLECPESVEPNLTCSDGAESSERTRTPPDLIQRVPSTHGAGVEPDGTTSWMLENRSNHVDARQLVSDINGNPYHRTPNRSVEDWSVTVSDCIIGNTDK